MPEKPKPPQEVVESEKKKRKIHDVNVLMRRQKEIAAEHVDMREKIKTESQPEAADLEISDGRELNRRKKTDILRLLIERGVMEKQVVREGESFSLDCRRGTDQIEAVSVLDDTGIPDHAWQIDERTIQDIKRIIAE